ncbi:MAG: FKBP-type peptidyl-prolyl cis-trans isomerase, partial [Gammaproteobacteria bacterium]
MIEAGKTVAFEYTLRLDDGSVVQTNKGSEPLTYVHGENQLLPALERELEGLDVNDRKEIRLAAADAYGEVRDDAFREVPAEQIPEGAR